MSVRRTGYHIRETYTPHLRSLVATLARHLYGLKWLGTSTVLLYSVSRATDNSCSRAKSAQVTNAYEGKGGFKKGFSTVCAGGGYQTLSTACYSIAVIEGVGCVPSTGAHVACPSRVHTSCNAASCCSCSVPCPMVPNSMDKQKALNLLLH